MKWIFLILILLSFSAMSPAKEMAGFYVLGPGVHEFMPCHSKDVYWVEGRQEAVAFLMSEYPRLARQAYEPVFVKADVQALKRKPNAPDRSYDKALRINQVMLIRRAGSGDCLH